MINPASQATSLSSLWRTAPRARPVVSSEHVALTDAARRGLAFTDVRPTVTRLDRTLLARLLVPSAGGGSVTALQKLLGDTAQSQPDFVAVRSGPGVTSMFAGGGNVTSWTHGTTVMTFFGDGAAPAAYKGVAITYGADTTAADRDNITGLAMSWLTIHLDDQQDARGAWNRPLIDASA